MWELFALIFLVTFGFGAAIIMARRYKSITYTQNIDVKDLAARIAKAVIKEISIESKGVVISSEARKKLDESQSKVIEIDERIIPIEENIKGIKSSINAITQEEIKEDNLDSSKGKLAGLFKKRK